LPGKGGINQNLLPFKELEKYTPPEKPDDAVILFHITQEMKDNVSKAARLQATSVTKLLNGLISDYLETLKQVLRPEKKKTGRGNVDSGQLEKAKELLRKKHPETVRLVDIANYCKVSQARAARIVDNLSGNLTDGEYDFLVYTDDDKTVGIFRDDKSGIKPW
jgi:hypothetical protein